MGIPGSAIPLLLRRAAAAGDDVYEIKNSLRFNRADTPYLYKSQTKGDRRQWTWSGWIKKTDLTNSQTLFQGRAGNGVQAAKSLEIQILSGTQLYISFCESGGTTIQWSAENQAFYRDPGAWQHWVIVLDTPNAVANERCRVYVNGKKVEAWGTRNTITKSFEYAINESGSHHAIGAHFSGDNVTAHFDGYFSDIHFLDGLCLSPAAFGSFDSTGVWNAKAFAIPTPNDGTTWSSTVTTGGASLYDTAFSPGSGKATNLFNSDGIEYGTWAGASSGIDNATGIVTWKPPEDITADSQIRIGFIKIKYTAKGTFTINGKDLLTDMFTQTGVGMSGTNGVSKWCNAPSRTITAADGITWAKYDNNNAVVP